MSLSALFITGPAGPVSGLKLATRPTQRLGALLCEASDFLAGWARDLCRRQSWRDVIDADACAAIVADFAATTSHAHAMAHRAQVHDEEAARLMHSAQSPESDGGVAITPREAAPILRCIKISSGVDSDLGSILGD